jgi:hypothetical protein
MAEQTFSANWNAEVPQAGMQALWRLAIWGGLATVALFAAAMSAYSSAGSQRQATSITSGQGPASTQGSPSQVSSGQFSSNQVSSGQMSFGQGPAQPRAAAEDFGARPSETAEETRRLAEAVRSLTADRDQALSRIATLERNLDGVTGSIKRDRMASAQQAAPQAPLPAPPQTPQALPQPPVAAASALPIARPETPVAAPVAEAAVTPTQPAPAQVTPAQAPAAKKSSASDLPQISTADAGNRAAMPASNLVRVSAPAEPLAAAGGLGIDVGGAVNYEGLRTLWHSTMGSDPALEELYPVVTVRENNKTHGVDLRLVVGPIADADAAERLCTTLAAAHHYCQPVAFEGQRLSPADMGPPKVASSHRSASHVSAPTVVPSVVPETPHFRAVTGK